MADLKIIAGDFLKGKNNSFHRILGQASFTLLTEKHKIMGETISITEVDTINIENDDTSAKKREITFSCKLKDGRQFMAKVDSDTFVQIKASLMDAPKQAAMEHAAHRKKVNIIEPKKQTNIPPVVIVGFVLFIFATIFPSLFMGISILSLVASLIYFFKKDIQTKFNEIKLPNVFPDHRTLVKNSIILSVLGLLVTTCSLDFKKYNAEQAKQEQENADKARVAQQKQKEKEAQQKKTAHKAMTQEARSFYSKGDLKSAYERYLIVKNSGGIPNEDKDKFVKTAVFSGDWNLKSGKPLEAKNAYSSALAISKENINAKTGLRKIEFKEKSERLQNLFLDQKYGAYLVEYDAFKKEFTVSKEQSNMAKRAKKVLEDEKIRGEKPENSSWDGSVKPVKDFLKSNLNDYDSAEFIDWFKVIPTNAPDGTPAWGVKVKFRAKNGFGAYINQLWFFYIQNGQVVGYNDELS